MSIPSSANKNHVNPLLSTVGGICSLIIVMGIGRFVYTALLPGMMETYCFGEDVAGIIAAWNYAGYLIGVLMMRNERAGIRRYILFVCLLFLSLLTTAAMGLITHVVSWYVIRFLAGFASGACFVLCSSIVIDTLAEMNRLVLVGFLYSGVGAGIVFGGLAAGGLEYFGGPADAWLGLSFLCLPLALTAIITLRPVVNLAPVLSVQNNSSAPHGKKRNTRQYRILLFSYFLEGFGYIIGTTFLVALIQAHTNSPVTAKLSWVVTGCAAAFSPPVWQHAARKGYIRILILAFFLQGVGILLPLVSSSILATLGGGLLLGGTFMGITVLSLQYGVILSDKSSAHTVAVMTALYGAGQILGPIISGLGPEGKGFSSAFIISSVSIFIAAGILLILLRDPPALPGRP